jgi:uncharacterized protein
MDETSIVWLRPDPYQGMEIATVRLDATTIQAWGCAIGSQPMPYRLNYELVTIDGFITSHLHVEARGANWHRTLDLRRSDSGLWSCNTTVEGKADLPVPGGDMSRLTGALDCDLGLSPLTNSMPILRHAIHKSGGTYDFRMAWVRVPDLSVHLAEQHYASVRSEDGMAVIRYSSGLFSADLRVDQRGIVVDYPGLAQQIAATPYSVG